MSDNAKSKHHAGGSHNVKAGSEHAPPKPLPNTKPLEQMSEADVLKILKASRPSAESKKLLDEKLAELHAQGIALEKEIFSNMEKHISDLLKGAQNEPAERAALDKEEFVLRHLRDPFGELLSKMKKENAEMDHKILASEAKTFQYLADTFADALHKKVKNTARSYSDSADKYQTAVSYWFKLRMFEQAHKACGLAADMYVRAAESLEHEEARKAPNSITMYISVGSKPVLFSKKEYEEAAKMHWLGALCCAYAGNLKAVNEELAKASALFRKAGIPPFYLKPEDYN